MSIEVKDRDLQTPLHYSVMVDEEQNFWNGNTRTVSFLVREEGK
jgi:hypothetical protein